MVITTKRKGAPVRRACGFDQRGPWIRRHIGGGRWGCSLISAALGGALLAACATVATNTLSPQEIAGLKLTAVAVTYKPDAQIQWDDGLRPTPRARV